jgi:catechol 2,3-dioxygenase
VASRADLGRALRRLVDTRTILQGASDHGVSEALYLADPDGNGIEIYRDRPREQWPFVGLPGASAKARNALRMGADPLDLDGILAEPDGTTPNGLAPFTVIRHVHLHVSHLDAPERSISGVLGSLMCSATVRALFKPPAYHRHRTNNGRASPPPPAGAIGLEFSSSSFPTRRRLATSRAPSMPPAHRGTR